MQTSKVMNDLRKIRDENSLRHLSQTPEEFSQEIQESTRWFIKELGKPIKNVIGGKTGILINELQYDGLLETTRL
ncbi:MAG: hypothetical protein FWC16_05210 [Defluviitaleaceae bacterium]|nr:hypothetical protein [Defluviitaleaceae bacterium]MCL2274306.1 hypothetical protein [Defluviitaleaceae bacterium]